MMYNIVGVLSPSIARSGWTGWEKSKTRHIAGSYLSLNIEAK